LIKSKSKENIYMNDNEEKFSLDYGTINSDWKNLHHILFIKASFISKMLVINMFIVLMFSKNLVLE
jgi:hypothetical protein